MFIGEIYINFYGKWEEREKIKEKEEENKKEEEKKEKEEEYREFGNFLSKGWKSFGWGDV